MTGVVETENEQPVQKIGLREALRLSSTPETVLWARMTRRSLAMIVNEEMRSTHDYPKTKGFTAWVAMLGFFLPRAYSNGYSMTRVRFLVSELRANWARHRSCPGTAHSMKSGKLAAHIEALKGTSEEIRQPGRTIRARTT